jgi:hypothetical protein
MRLPERARAFVAVIVITACGGDGTPNLNQHLPDADPTCSRCAPGEMCCNAMCVNVATDRDHCGSCTNLCSRDHSDGYAGGACTCNGGPACQGSATCCPGAGCKTLSENDPANCGACGRACDPGQSCRGGNCVNTMCNGQPCEFLCCGTTCADISMDPNNCGQCGRQCNASIGEMCRPGPGGLGVCQTICGGLMCDPGQGCCAGTCTDLSFDQFNCGMCGRQCDVSTQFCSNGCCADFITGQCGGGDGGIGDGGIGDGGSCVPVFGTCFLNTQCCSGNCWATTGGPPFCLPPMDDGGVGDAGCSGIGTGCQSNVQCCSGSCVGGFCAGLPDARPADAQLRDGGAPPSDGGSFSIEREP